MRVAIRRVSVAFARRSVAAPARRVVFGAAVGLTAVAATTTTTGHQGASVAVTNTRERSVAHVSSSAASQSKNAASAASKPLHWAADADGINAQQRALAKVTSSDPLERLQSAQTRELLQQAYEVPGVARATLADETIADKTIASGEEQAFLSKMEKEDGADVLPILRRQEWAVHLAPSASSAPRTTDAAATLVCYYQEGTQKILFKRLSLAA